MDELRRSAGGPGVNDPPDASASPPVTAHLTQNLKRADTATQGGEAQAATHADNRLGSGGGRITLKRTLIAGVAALGIAACGGTHQVASTQMTNTSGQAAKAAKERAEEAASPPPPIQPVFANPVAGEGVWKPTGPPVDGGSPVLVTSFRPEVGHPDIVAYVAWFDHTRTELAYYPGGSEPPKAAVRGPTMVPYSQRWRLLATFNAGFTYTDGNNGSTDNGLVNEPLADGNATLVGYRDGRVDIVKWSGGPSAGPDVAWARQSLAPIVWNGQLNPNLDANPDSAQWGYTLGGVPRVPRTGVGIDRHGNLFFVVATEQTVITLAKILQHIGAVRAMEFDINYEWHTLITYSHQNGLDPHLLEPQNQQTPTRYLVPDSRDFFAVYRRLPGPVTVPFK